MCVAALALLAALFAGAGPASTAYEDTLVGTEIVPVSSTEGTFVGVAAGQLPAAWRAQITHVRLATGPSVAITGGTFVLVTPSHGKLTGAVTGGSVTVADSGSRCRDQKYTVVAVLTIGSFEGTLTHHRRTVFGHCLLYAATIRGHGFFNA